jgi:hypothetical protein
MSLVFRTLSIMLLMTAVYLVGSWLIWIAPWEDFSSNRFPFFGAIMTVALAVLLLVIFAIWGVVSAVYMIFEIKTKHTFWFPQQRKYRNFAAMYIFGSAYDIMLLFGSIYVFLSRYTHAAFTESLSGNIKRDYKVFGA